MNRFFIFIPSLLAIFPSLFLFFMNEEAIYIPFYAVSFGLFGVGVMVFFCTLALKLFIKDLPKAIILTSIGVLAVFYYGYFFEIVRTMHLGNFAFNSHKKAVLFWGISMLGAGFLVWRTRKNMRFLCTVVGIFTMVLFTVSFGFFAAGTIKKFSQNNTTLLLPTTPKDAVSLEYVHALLGYAPDVYYIVPDGYENTSVLKEFFGYDNQEFLSYLEQKGFMIVPNSKSNYPNTLFSIPATLNMEYGDVLIPEFLSSPISARKKLIEENRVAMLFKSLGYRYVAIASDNTSFSGDKADARFGPSLLFRLLMKPTIFDPVSQRFRNRVLDAFNSFDEASALPGPKFVLAHIIAPHDPYVFGPNGEDIGFHAGEAHSANDMKLYLDQLKFVNQELEKTVDVILKNSARTPIIIIQSDHGVSLPNSYGVETVRDARFKNVSAFLLPKEAGNLPASNINTFRFIFDRYFGTSFGLLEDKKVYANFPI